MYISHKSIFKRLRADHYSYNSPAVLNPQPLMAHLNFVLIGNTGNGKSRTGNTIFKKNAFKSTGMTSSVTKETVFDESQTDDGRWLRVVDTPGICDPEKKTPILSQVKETLRSTRQFSGNGYHAVLLVSRYGVMLKEDREIFENIRVHFGEEFFTKHCIRIITFGDNFERDQQEPRQSFEDWCSDQDVVFRSLISQCGGRILLFDNMQNEEMLNTQVRKLITMTEKLQLEDGERLTKRKLQHLSREK